MIINGAGANFPQPVYARWFEKYSNVDDSVRFNYHGVGSAGGRTMILDGITDFGASDVPISDESQAKSPHAIWHLPTVASAVAICHNLKGFPDVRLDGPAVAGIFLGRITKWNDPAIAAQNPDVSLPDRDIVVIHPTESGTLTDIFAQYLAAVSPEWRARFGHQREIAWPVGRDALHNSGVAKLLRETPSSIAFIELSVANRSNVRLVALRNAAGNYVRPDAASVTEAAATATIPDDLRLSLVNAPGAKAYPIGIVTWLLVDSQPKSPAKGRKLAAFLKWVYHDGEDLATSIGFVPLPAVIRERVLARVDAMKLAGPS